MSEEAIPEHYKLEELVGKTAQLQPERGSYRIIIDCIGEMALVSSNYPVSYTYKGRQLELTIPNISISIQRLYEIEIGDLATIRFITNADRDQELCIRLIGELANRWRLPSAGELDLPTTQLSALPDCFLRFFAANCGHLAGYYRVSGLYEYTHGRSGRCTAQAYLTKHPNELPGYAAYCYHCNKLNYAAIDLFDQSVSDIALSQAGVIHIHRNFRLQHIFDLHRCFQEIYNKFTTTDAHCATEDGRTTTTVCQAMRSIRFLCRKTNYFFAPGLDQHLRLASSRSFLTRSSYLANGYDKLIRDVYEAVGLNFAPETYKYCNLDLLFLPIIIRLFLRRDEQLTNLTLNVPFVKVHNLADFVTTLQQCSDIVAKLADYECVLSRFDKTIRETRESNLDFAISTLLQLRNRLQKKLGNDIDCVLTKESVILSHKAAQQCLCCYDNFELFNVMLIKFLIVYQTNVYGAVEIFRSSNNYTEHLREYQDDLLRISNYLSMYDEVELIQRKSKEYLQTQSAMERKSRYQKFREQILLMQTLFKMENDIKQKKKLLRTIKRIQKFTISLCMGHQLVRMASEYYSYVRERFHAATEISSFYRMLVSERRYLLVRTAARAIQLFYGEKRTKAEILVKAANHYNSEKALYQSVVTIETAVRSKLRRKRNNAIILCLIRLKRARILAIIEIQSYFRAAIETHHYERLLECASIIQRGIRAYFINALIKELSARYLAERQRVFGAAELIQKRFAQLKVEQNAVNAARRMYAGTMLRFSSAVAIEAAYREFAATKIRASRKNAVTAVKQHVVRALLGRKLIRMASAYLLERHTEYKAATCVERFARRLTVEKYIMNIATNTHALQRNIYEASVSLQSAARARIWSVKYRQMVDAAAVIQKCVANSRARRHMVELAAKCHLGMLEKYGATVLIQNSIKDLIARRNMVSRALRHYKRQQLKYGASMCIQRCLRRRRQENSYHDMLRRVRLIERAVKQRADAARLLTAAESCYLRRREERRSAAVIGAWLRGSAGRRALAELAAGASKIQRFARRHRFCEKLREAAGRYHRETALRHAAAVAVQARCRQRRQRSKYLEELAEIERLQALLRRAVGHIRYREYMVEEAADLALVRRQNHKNVVRLERALARTLQETRLLLEARDHYLGISQRFAAAAMIEQIYRRIATDRMETGRILQQELLQNIRKAAITIEGFARERQNTKKLETVQKQLEEQDSLESSLHSITNSPSDDVVSRDLAELGAARVVERFYRLDTFYRYRISLAWFKYKLKRLRKVYIEYRRLTQTEQWMEANRARKNVSANIQQKQTLMQELDNLIRIVVVSSNPLTQSAAWEKILIAFSLNPELIAQKLVYSDRYSAYNIDKQPFCLYYALFACIGQLNKGLGDRHFANYCVNLYRLIYLFRNTVWHTTKYNSTFVPNNLVTALELRRLRFDESFLNKFYINMKFISKYMQRPAVEHVGLGFLQYVKNTHLKLYNSLACVRQQWLRSD